MNGDKQKFEDFLRGFKPRRPRPLPLVTGIWLDARRLAAAAVILAAISGSLYVGSQTSRTKYADQQPTISQERGGTMSVGPSTSSLALTQIALGDVKQFDAEIDELAPAALRCCEGPNSSLALLAKP
jgi:hypothetical protein